MIIEKARPAGANPEQFLVCLRVISLHDMSRISEPCFWLVNHEVELRRRHDRNCGVYDGCLPEASHAMLDPAGDVGHLRGHATECRRAGIQVR